MQRTIATVALLLSAATSIAESPRGQWQYYGGDAGSTKYSSLAQIDASNVGSLQIAWTWNSPDNLLGTQTRERPGYFKPTPIMIDGVLYTSTSFGQVAAIDPGTGELATAVAVTSEPSVLDCQLGPRKWTAV